MRLEGGIKVVKGWMGWVLPLRRPVVCMQSFYRNAPRGAFRVVVWAGSLNTGQAKKFPR